MLSIENPRRDPPCPCEISQLKSGSDERSSDKLEVADLLNTGLDDDNNYPLPKFSIRDYVSNTRSKDIKNNWPFSQKNLQLCLKHGLRDLLPPFQSLDEVRNSLHNQSNIGGVLVDEENACTLKGEPSRSSDHCVFVDSENAGCNQELAGDCFSRNPSGSEGEKDFPSTTRSQSCSDIDSVPINKSPCLELEANTLPEPSRAKPEVVIPPASNKIERINQPPVKKCKLIVKLGNIAQPSTKEDTAVNNFMVSETMASKVCPVCKTFSSSSNTTLNAHIDQCLSGESSTKCASDSKVIKHRIKPRKIKSMVDIYATAPHCTLEELDRRNGTSWALNSCLPAQEIEICADQNTQGLCSLNLQETPNEGAVYIDANGTKLRILSKLNDPALGLKVVDNPQPKRLIKGDKGSKFLLAKKKKKKQIQKLQKLLKHAPQDKKLSTSRPHQTSEINDGHDRYFSREENYKKEECLMQQLKAFNHAKLSKPEMIRGWVCSKRTGLTKKFNGRDDGLHSGDSVDRDLVPANNQSYFVNSHVKEIGVMKIPNGNSASPGTSKRIDNSLHEPHDDYREHRSLRKRMGFSSVGSQVCHDRKRSRVFPEFAEHGVKQLRKVDSYCKENNGSVLSKRRVEIKVASGRNVDHSVIDPKLSAGHYSLLSKSRRFSSLKKKLFSAGQASAADSKFHSKRKCSVIKKSRVHCLSESNEGVMTSQSGVDQHQHFMQNLSEDQPKMQMTSPEESVDRTRVLKIRSRGEHMISRKEEAVALKSSKSSPISYDHDAGENGGSFMLGGVFARTSDTVDAAGENTDTCNTNFDIELASEVAVGGPFMGFSKSLDLGFHGLAGTSDTGCDSERFIEVYKGPLFVAEAPKNSPGPILTGGQEIFCADEVDENMIRENVRVVVELDSGNGQGNYFTEIDPIPIPGPPGSFLPSPGHMDSEDLQGNSSLTSNRVQSSDEHRELVDHSSDSPISATSTISNSTLARSDSKSSELSVGPPLLQDEMRCGFTTAVNVDPVVENFSPVGKATAAGEAKLGLDQLNVNRNVPEKGPFRFRNDQKRFRNDQPCCCSRKEGGSSPNIALNHQELQLLRRETMTSVLVPTGGKQLSSDLTRRFDGLRSEMLPIRDGSAEPEEDATKSQTGNISSRVSADPGVKFPIRSDCESASPPASNPVLRLMGKNLMVVNKEENVSPQLRPSQSSTMFCHADPQAVAVSGNFTENTRNEGNHRLPCGVSQGSYFFDRTETIKAVTQPSDVRWSNGFENHGNSGIPQISPLTSPAMLLSRSAARGFTGSLKHLEYTGGYCSPTQQLQPMNGLGTLMTYDMEKIDGIPSLRWRSADSTANSIDDTPEDEVDLTTVAPHNQGRREAMGSSGDISVSMSSFCDSRNVNAFYITQQYESAAYSGSLVDAGFRMPLPNGGNANPLRWNCSPEISNLLHPSSLTDTSSSKAPLRSELYNSSGFH